MSLNQPFDDLLQSMPDEDTTTPELVELEYSAHGELAEIFGDGRFSGQITHGCMSMTVACHGLAKRAGWWNDPVTGEPVERNDGELIALMHSELSEALEALRKDRNDDHLPHRKGVEVELADVLVRIFDYAGARKLDLAGAMIEKLAYNARRADHTPAARAQADGKKF